MVARESDFVEAPWERRRRGETPFPIQAPIAPGGPAPGAPQAPQEYIAPFSYQSPEFRPQGGWGQQGRRQQYMGPMRPDVPELNVQPYEGVNAEQLFADPSYQFRFNQGRQALERSAAARGTLFGGNTLQALTDYGQQAASQEYAAAEDRARQQYMMNYAPQLAQWQAQLEAERMAFDRPWEAYQFGQTLNQAQYDAQLRAHIAALDDEFRREQMLYQGGLGSY